MHTPLVALVALFATASACKPVQSNSASFSASPSKAVSEALYSSISSEQKKPEVTAAADAILSRPMLNLMNSAAVSVGDGPVTINGQTFKNLRSSYMADKAAQANMKEFSALFANVRDFLAANGVSGGIKPADVEAYVSLGTRGLTGLSSKQAMSVDERSTILSAIKVTVMLAAMRQPSGGVDLHLVDASPTAAPPATTPAPAASPKNFQCPHGDAKASSGCLQDALPNALGLGVGYYTVNADDNNDKHQYWQDAFKPASHNNSAFLRCGADQLNKDSDWGWIPDPKNPKGGTSCHR